MTPLPVIITRAQPGADETARAVAALGLTPILSPMLTLQRDPSVSLPAPETIAGLIFTSANGVRFYAEAETSRPSPAWCVGPATAAAARQSGFKTVHESAGDSVALAHFIAANTSPEPRPLLHVANAAATGDLANTLDTLGFRTQFAPLYQAVPVQSLTREVMHTLTADEPSLLLIHSRKGAEAFIPAASHLRLNQVHAVAISERAAAPLRAAQLQIDAIAVAPNEAALIAALKHVAATLSA